MNVIRLFLYTISSRIRNKDGKIRYVDFKMIGSDKNEVKSTLERLFPDCESHITSIGEVESHLISKELIDRIYKIENEKRNPQKKNDFPVKPSSFSYNIFEKDEKPIKWEI